LGILKQKAGDYEASIEILSKGIEHFQQDMQLNLCLGISYMNIGAFDKALSRLLPFQDFKEVPGFIASCYEAMGESEKASQFRKKI